MFSYISMLFRFSNLDAGSIRDIQIYHERPAKSTPC